MVAGWLSWLPCDILSPSKGSSASAMAGKANRAARAALRKAMGLIGDSLVSGWRMAHALAHTTSKIVGQAGRKSQGRRREFIDRARGLGCRPTHGSRRKKRSLLRSRLRLARTPTG